MDRRAFRRALRYGFGRAILHLRGHDAARYRDDILDGCLHDWIFLPHMRGMRSRYMFEIIALTGERAFYRDRVLAAVASARDERDWYRDRDYDHVFGIAWRFAEEGDEAARDALDHALERLPFVDDLAHLHAIPHHGPAGLVRVLRLRLDRLDADGDVRAASEIVGSFLVDDATERWGRRAVAAAVRAAGHADPRIKAWWAEYRRQKATWRQDEAAGRQDPGKRRGRPIPTYEQVKQILANPNVGRALSGGYWTHALRTWRSAATDEEWWRLAAELADPRDEDPRWQRAVRELSDRRAFPGDPQRLIATVRAARLDRRRDQPDVNGAGRPTGSTLSRRAANAMTALARMTHPAVRFFALELLETPTWTSKAAPLLVENYVDGDLEMLAAVFLRVRSEIRRHAIGYSMLEIDALFAPAGVPPVLLYLYERVRCEECRADLLARLHAHAALPAAVADECCLDGDVMVRKLIAELVLDACFGSHGRAQSGGGSEVAATARR